MSYIYICIKEGVRDLIDQLPDDHQKLDIYVEIGENYDVSQLNGQAFKTLNTNADKNSVYAIKHTNEKVNYAHIVYLIINMFNA